MFALEMMKVNYMNISAHFRHVLLNTTLCGSRIYVPLNLKLAFSSTKVPESKPGPNIPKNKIGDVFSSSSQTENGLIYDKKPFKMRCCASKTYSWCLCGRSKNQPLCDGTHKNPYLKITLRPVRFQVPEDKEYWLCNCKQTSNRPFCDGTHKRQDIQEAVK